MKRLDEKIAIITGSAEGIGFAIARKMAIEGATVILSDIQERKGEMAAQTLRDSGYSAEFRNCDVAKYSDVSLLINTTVEQFGRVDILVNNAAISIGGMPIHEMTLEEWNQLMSVNLNSVFYGCKSVIPPMISSGGGVIISLASAQGHIGIDGWTAYAGAKGAIMSMSRQMAVEFGKNNIRVNTISPGTIDTPMHKQVIDQLGSHFADTDVKMHPIGRIGTPEEVAEAAVYLASDLAGFTTGIDLKVDGGLTCTPRFVPELFEPDGV
jgi:NAD(P)-dependent dehydrogenase (short-subunit alcohol dehydrogenase family)